MIKIGNDWDDILKDIFEDKNFIDFYDFMLREYDKYILYPAKEDIFRALKLTSFSKLKVLILGQDPYHGPGQADGLAFSVKKGISLPPSLRNIFKELKNDLKIEVPLNGDLEKWAKEGVLLLNASLTVRQASPNFYAKSYWSIFTDFIIKKINENKENVVYILWGNKAQEKAQFIDANKNCIIKSVHPSPLSASRGFFNSKPFSKANAYLFSQGKKEIDWRL